MCSGWCIFGRMFDFIWLDELILGLVCYIGCNLYWLLLVIMCLCMLWWCSVWFFGIYDVLFMLMVVEVIL